MNDAPVDLTALQAELHALRQRVAELEAQQATSAERERILREEQDRNRVAAEVRPNQQLCAEIAIREQAEKALRESEERFRQLFEESGVPAMLMSVDGRRYLRVNRAMCTVLGYTPEEMTTCPNLPLAPPEEYARWQHDAARHLHAGWHQTQQEVYRFKHKDGTDRWLLTSTMLLRDPHGTPLYIIGQGQDITVRKHTEEVLRKQAEIIDQVHDAVMTTDLDGIITSCNQGGERMFGYTSHELCGQSVLLLFPEEDRPAFAPPCIFPLLAHGRHDFATRQRRKSGETFYGHISLSLLRQPDGTPQGVVGFAIDVTAQRKAENWLEGLIATTQDAVISIDRHARIVRFNAAAEKIFGYSKREVEGQRVNLLMPDPYASEHDGYIARYEETHEPRAIGRIRTVTGKRKSGELFPLELSVTEIAIDDEIHYAAFIRDISEKVRLQEKALEHERLAAIGVTAAKLAHEIGNPLNSMAMSIQLLERRLASTGSDDRVVERVRGVREHIARLTHLLHEFRNLSRRQDYRLVPTNLTHLVTEVLSVETDHYTARGVTIVHDSAPDLPFVKADAGKLRQVLINLCKNAVEAMPDGGTLTVRAQRGENNHVQLHITDTGSGIPNGVNIFEPFITTKPEGTGLGLPVVRQIVEAHAGELTYRTALGQGTTFTVTLVAVDAKTPAPTDTRTLVRRTVEGLAVVLWEPIAQVIEQLVSMSLLT